MVIYKSNKFCTVNEVGLQELCGRYGLEFIAAYSPDDRVGFRGQLASLLPDQFWIDLTRYIRERWTLVVLEHDLTMSGFTTHAHLLTNRGAHEILPQMKLKFKHSVSDKKRRKYLGIKDTPESTLVRNRPYKTIEASKREKPQ